eukprot:1196174-Prorocentrum_minimum.AAC.14
MEEEVPIEPNNFDAICLGTGLVEAIVAGVTVKVETSARCLSAYTARTKTRWASLSLSSLNEWNAGRKSSPRAKNKADGEAQGVSSDNDASQDCERLSVDPLAGEAILFSNVEVDDVLGDENR